MNSWEKLTDAQRAEVARAFNEMARTMIEGGC